MPFIVDLEHGVDAPAIERLLDTAFGPDRWARTAYRFREGVPPVHGLGFVTRECGRLTGSIRFWPVRLETPAEEKTFPALLLGPLGVEPELRGQGIGTALLRRGLAEAAARGYERIFLIGDMPYYGRVGFRRVLPARCGMPGPVDAARLLVWTAAPDCVLPEEFDLRPLRG